MSKILFVTSDNFDAKFSRVLFLNWIKTNKKVSSVLVCPEGKYKISYSGETIYMNKRGVSFSNISLLRKTVHKNKFNIIIFRGIENIIMSLFFKKSKMKYIFLITGLGKIFSKNRLFSYLIKIPYLFCVKYLLRRLSAKLVVQNMIDKDFFNYDDTYILKSSGITVEAFNNKKKIINPINIISSARLGKSKGIIEILKLAKEIKDDDRFRFNIFGSYSHLSKKFISEIKFLNKSNNIFFHGENFKIDKYLKCSHFSYFPTRYREGSPRFLIQSLYYGNVIYTTDMPGCSEFISDQNGFFIKNPSEDISNMLNIFENNFKEMSNRSKMLYSKKFCNEKIFNDFYNIIITD